MRDFRAGLVLSLTVIVAAPLAAAGPVGELDGGAAAGAERNLFRIVATDAGMVLPFEIAE